MANLVQIVGTQVRVDTSTAAEAKLAIKELKLKKKEYSLQKKALLDQEKMIRAQYTAEVRSRGSMMRGEEASESLFEQFNPHQGTTEGLF